MWNLISVYLEMVLVSVQDRCMVCTKRTIGPEIIFGRSRWYYLVTRLKWKHVSDRLEIVLILTQNRCTVCAEGTMGSIIILDAPDGTPT
jgi:hypothetical protein